MGDIERERERKRERERERERVAIPTPSLLNNERNDREMEEVVYLVLS